MLNLILSGSQYIYQNLIKTIWFAAVTWKAHILHGAHQNSRHSDSCPDSAGRAAAGPAPSARLRPSRARSPRPCEPLTAPSPEQFRTAEEPTPSHSPKDGAARVRSSEDKTFGGIWGSQVGSLLSELLPQQMSSCNIFGFSPPLNIHAIGNIYMK